MVETGLKCWSRRAFSGFMACDEPDEVEVEVGAEEAPGAAVFVHCEEWVAPWLVAVVSDLKGWRSSLFWGLDISRVHFCLDLPPRFLQDLDLSLEQRDLLGFEFQILYFVQARHQKVTCGLQFKHQ